MYIQDLFPYIRPCIAIGTAKQMLKSHAMLPRHKVAVDQLLEGLRREPGQVFVRPPGFGKTRTAVATVIQMARKYNLPMRCLILGPSMLQQTWKDEIAACCTCRFVAVGRGKSIKTRQAMADAHFVYVSHRMLVTNKDVLADCVQWPFVIGVRTLTVALVVFLKMHAAVDEAHQLRTPTTKLHQRVQAFRSLHCDSKFLLLTATPFVNYALDISSLLAIAANDQTLLSYIGIPTQQHYTKLLFNTCDDTSWLKSITCNRIVETLVMTDAETRAYNKHVAQFVETYDYAKAHNVKNTQNVRGAIMSLRRHLGAYTTTHARSMR